MTYDMGAITLDGRPIILHVEVPATGAVSGDTDGRGWECTCGVWYRHPTPDRAAVADTAEQHGFNTGHSINVATFR